MQFWIFYNVTIGINQSRRVTNIVCYNRYNFSFKTFFNSKRSIFTTVLLICVKRTSCFSKCLVVSIYIFQIKFHIIQSRGYTCIINIYPYFGIFYKKESICGSFNCITLIWMSSKLKLCNLRFCFIKMNNKRLRCLGIYFVTILCIVYSISKQIVIAFFRNSICICC